MGVHAKLSASGAYRWLACPPSVQLEQEFKDEESAYALEGTLAHSLAEIKLSKHFKKIDTRKYNKEFKKIAENELFSKEMEDHCDELVAYVASKYEEYEKAEKMPEVFFEERLNFSRFVPEGFGTGDVIICSLDHIDVIDLKYGKGVFVEAENNPQLRLYGIGAYETYNWLYSFSSVTTTVYQPRISNVSSETLSVKELLAWGESIKGIAKMADKGEGDFKAGGHCGFCKARTTCRARAEENIKVAQDEFKEPALLSNDEIAELLTKTGEVQSWAKDVENYALKQARDHGIKFKGWKLVEGRSNRKYADEAAIINVLESSGYKSDDITNTKLKGITDMTKILGKNTVNDLIGEFIVKPQGAPTLVEESDKRPEFSSAAEDFKDEKGE